MAKPSSVPMERISAHIPAELHEWFSGRAYTHRLSISKLLEAVLTWYRQAIEEGERGG